MSDNAREDRTIIGIYHLTKRYGERMALDDVSLTVANGES